ncbi:uncharacterized protein BX663DRAFT_89551 [Cokeromyces recurvatus]|uniref:uncharacterized protein n=1 Tax=Cokeromyces recurvatus TaxID=90255 RepID=UPI00221F429B|nr:uncharacterized protein BX663DRAFT_89551 [Cokeromyces recurvatus]KAI7901813.1 hypothetical protein BX663DRAFT_89551 [Cokeromyces recurvatus]
MQKKKMSVRDWSFSSPVLNNTQNSELPPSPFSRIDSFDHQQKLEKDFCKDFLCCGLCLDNLHELLEHYEGHHLPRNNNTNTTEIVEEGKEAVVPIHQGLLNTSFSSLLPLPLKQRSTIAGLNMLENTNKHNSSLDLKNELTTTLNSLADIVHSPSSSLKLNNNNVSDDDDISMSLLADNSTLSQQSNSPLSELSVFEDTTDRPYRCHIENCDKAYKNANGLKYHRIHGHCQSSDSNDLLGKPFICFVSSCRKGYKNLNGLKYHMEHAHMMKVANLTSDLFLGNNRSPQGTKRRTT